MVQATWSVFTIVLLLRGNMAELVMHSSSEGHLNFSISPMCVNRWNAAVNQSFGLHKKVGSPRLHMHQFQGEVLFIHLGKTGGGSVGQLLKDENVSYDQIHMYPVILPALRSHPYIVVTVRDPVARFISAYNWGVKLRQPWAMNLAHCYDLNQFAMEFANRRINQSSSRLEGIQCDKYIREDFGHVTMDSCFYMGGIIRDPILQSKKLMFVVRTEMLINDTDALVERLNFKLLNTHEHDAKLSHKHDNSAAHNTTQVLQPLVQHALEVALVDEYQIANRILRVSINALQSAYCVTYADIYGLRCSDF